MSQTHTDKPSSVITIHIDRTRITHILKSILLIVVGGLACLLITISAFVAVTRHHHSVSIPEAHIEALMGAGYTRAAAEKYLANKQSVDEAAVSALMKGGMTRDQAVKSVREHPISAGAGEGPLGAYRDRSSHVSTVSSSGGSGDSPQYQRAVPASAQITPPQPAPVPQYPKLVRVLGLTLTKQVVVIGVESTNTHSPSPLIDLADFNYPCEDRLGYHIFTRSIAPDNTKPPKYRARYVAYKNFSRGQTVAEVVPNHVLDGKLIPYVKPGWSESTPDEFYVLSHTRDGEIWLLECKSSNLSSERGAVNDSGRRSITYSISNWKDALLKEVIATKGDPDFGLSAPVYDPQYMRPLKIVD